MKGNSLQKPWDADKIDLQDGRHMNQKCKATHDISTESMVETTFRLKMIGRLEQFVCREYDAASCMSTF